MQIRLIGLAILLLGVLTGCGSTETKPAMTPLEFQSLQSRDFEAPKHVVFPSVISVFQDIGYTITNADLETGLIAAESTSDSDFATKFWLGITKVNQTKATAFVETIGGKTRARLNFVETSQTSTGWGQTDRQDKAILNAQLYQNAFEKIDSAIFVRTQSQ